MKIVRIPTSAAASQEEKRNKTSVDVAIASSCNTSINRNRAVETETESIIDDKGENDEIQIQNLPFNLRCHATPLSGRTVTTRVPILKGTTVFQEIPFAHSIHFSSRKSTCDACFAQLANNNDDDDDDDSYNTQHQTLGFPCTGGCGIHYCSEICRNKSFARHSSICHLIRQTNGNSKNARYMNQSLSLLIALSSNPRPLQDVMTMMVDGYTKKGDRDTALAERKFRALSHSIEKEGKVLEPSGSYAAALSTKNLNGIGIYNSYGDEVAVALCPALAMVNHNCFPNCQQITKDGSCQLRALRDIDSGEELSYSYISLEGTEVERKSAIEENWKFTCRCYRCSGGDCRAFDAAHTCYCGAVCYDVDRTAAECVCNNGKVVRSY